MYQIITLDLKLTQSYMSTVLSVNMEGGAQAHTCTKQNKLQHFRLLHS